MSEALVNFFIENLGGIVSKEIIVFIVSLLPILELRGGILAGYLLGLDFVPTFLISFVGNMLPIPFILYFIQFIFKVLKGFLLQFLSMYTLLKKRKVIKKSNI